MPSSLFRKMGEDIQDGNRGIDEVHQEVYTQFG